MALNTVEEIGRDPRIQAAIDIFNSDPESVIQTAVAIQQIPAPTFHEAERAAYVRARFAEMDLAAISQDELNNVYGMVPGSGEGKPIVVSAHLDTVFDHGTDLSTRVEKKGSSIRRIYGPGIADNSLGVAGLIVLASVFRDQALTPQSDVWLTANACEEGLGDLKGMKALVERFGHEAVYIVIEGGSFGLVFHEAVGVNRFLIEVRTPGGHSWGDYGKPSAIHELSSLINRITAIELPAKPKTTVNVGVIEGGTTINVIASHAQCQLDLRSGSKKHLQTLTTEVRRLAEETSRLPNVQVSMRPIGRRPSGRISPETEVVKNALSALKHVGYSSPELVAGSTDASVPLSLGIPSVCIGLAKSGNTHRTDEFVDITMLPQGLQQLLLLVLTSAGLESAA